MRAACYLRSLLRGFLSSDIRQTALDISEVCRPTCSFIIIALSFPEVAHSTLVIFHFSLFAVSYI